MEVEVKLRLPNIDSHRQVTTLLAPFHVKTHRQENLFFDGSAGELSSKHAVLRLRFYDDDVRCVVSLKAKAVLVDGVSRVEEDEEDLDPKIGRDCVAKPWKLGSVESRILKRVKEELGVVNKDGYVGLGGFGNVRSVFDWKGLKLEVDETMFTFGNLYEIEGLESLVEHLKKELVEVKEQSSNMSTEIEELERTCMEDACVLESNLEEFKFSLKYTTHQDTAAAMASRVVDSPLPSRDDSTSMIVHEGINLELLELENEIDEKKTVLKSFQDLHHMVQWFDVMEQIEETLTGLKVIAFDEKTIRLLLQTHLPKLESLPCQRQFEGMIEPAVLKHELVIEVLQETMKLQNVEIFPNDVFVSDILDAAKSSSKFSLQWLITKVQGRIIICTLRQVLVKDANKLRHSIEYIDRDEIIVARMAGGIDASIKVSHCWPLLKSPLKLTFLNSSNHSKEILCKVEEEANTLDGHVRQRISSFVDAIEKLLMKADSPGFPISWQSQSIAD